MKKTIALLLALMLLVCSSPVYADDYIDDGYGTDTDEIIENYSDVYGWDPDKMGSYAWIGKDKDIYVRQYYYEQSYYEDLIDTSIGLAADLGIVTNISTGNGSADLMIALAYEEYYNWVGSGTLFVKYNNWSGGAWCCSFIVWLSKQCGLCDVNGGAGVFHDTGGCGQMQNYFLDKGYDRFLATEASCYGGSYEVLPGDVLIFGNHEHIGLIVGVGEDYLTIIEGNHGHRVTCINYTKSACYRDVYHNLGLIGAYIYRVIYPDNISTVYNYMTANMGFNTAAACGVLANIAYESNFEYLSASGLCNWDEDKIEAMKDFCTKNNLKYDTITAQLKYFEYDLKTNYHDVYTALKSVDNTSDGAYSAGNMLSAEYFRPNAASTNIAAHRGSVAGTSYFPQYNKEKTNEH